VKFVPKRGDLIWLNFSPAAGHEQAGRRPALVLSHESYSRNSGMAVVCPITSRAKGYPFEMEIGLGAPASGVVLADAIRNIDLRVREPEFIGKAPTATLDRVCAAVAELLTLKLPSPTDRSV